MFQSTRPRGARLYGNYLVMRQYRFNPRARGGRDQAGLTGWAQRLVSIHAPAGGATKIAVIRLV